MEMTDTPKTTELLLDLVRYEICGTTLPDAVKDNALSADELRALYTSAKVQDLVHLVGDALIKNDLLEDGGAKEAFRREVIAALYRYERISSELHRASDALDNAKIAYVPLKGALLRDLYPEPWMRTSCDIDLLVRAEDMQAAEDVLAASLGCKKVDFTAHDISYRTACDVTLELHFSLIEEGRIAKADEPLADIWSVAEPARDGGKFEMRLPDEYFYYYHIVHMAKHLSTGGCGMRPFVDLWLLDKAGRPDGVDRLLREGGLLRLGEVASLLADDFMTGKEPEGLARSLADYIFSASIYGSVENYTAVKSSEKNGKLAFVFYRIFLPYKELSGFYPVLKDKPWLTPVYQIRRWMRFVVEGRVKKGVREFHSVMNGEHEKVDGIAELMRELGITK